MYICQNCYDCRGENAFVFKMTSSVCQFCEMKKRCFDIPIYALRHWKEVAEFQGWVDSYSRKQET